jgi:hypothetical protein
VQLAQVAHRPTLTRVLSDGIHEATRFVLPALASLALFVIAACSREPRANTGVVQSATSPACPAAVTASIAKAFPAAAITRCDAEQEDRRDQYDVRVDKSGGEMLEADLTALDRVPAHVMTAFRVNYPGAKPARAERWVRTGKGILYEIKVRRRPQAQGGHLRRGRGIRRRGVMRGFTWCGPELRQLARAVTLRGARETPASPV